MAHFDKDGNYVGNQNTGPGGEDLYTGGDRSDALFNNGLKLEWYHIPSGNSVAFKAFLTSFTDTFDSKWEEEDVFGRNDGYQNFKNTKRAVSIGWTVVAGGEEEARSNLRKTSLLAMMVYPSYTSDTGPEGLIGNATSISASPLFRLKFLNLVQDVSTGSPPLAPANLSGLVGKVDGFEFVHNVEAGYFLNEDGLYPKEISITCTYTVLHTHSTGWKGSDFRNTAFPYGEEQGYSFDPGIDTSPLTPAEKKLEEPNSAEDSNNDEYISSQTNVMLKG